MQLLPRFQMEIPSGLERTQTKSLRSGLGQLATHHMKTLLHKGDRVKIVSRGRGYYKRLLAYVILPDGTNVNYRMVADGYACVYTWHGKRPEGVGVLEFVKLKAFLLQAKKEKRGLWGVDFELMNCLCR